MNLHGRAGVYCNLHGPRTISSTEPGALVLMQRFTEHRVESERQCRAAGSAGY